MKQTVEIKNSFIIEREQIGRVIMVLYNKNSTHFVLGALASSMDKSVEGSLACCPMTSLYW